VIVVSDTTAITSLLKIDRATLLSELFGNVIVPEAVRAELLKYHSELPQFLRVHSVTNRDAVNSLLLNIDQGEAEAIVLAEELGADALLIDEKRGRTIAEHRGLRCLGLAGALLMAKQNRLIPSLADLLNSLEREANFYLDEGLKKFLLVRANESG
jgi:predicted nucleic acid-binding protein